jgi:hypothetical protein
VTQPNEVGAAAAPQPSDPALTGAAAAPQPSEPALTGAEVAPQPSYPLTHALTAALAGHDGPVLLLAPDVPRLDESLARTALDDLRRGCSIALASGFEARACLLALARPDPRLFALVAAGASRRAIVDLVETAAEAGGEVGFLRHERRLVTPADAAALALDPLADATLRALASPPR